jgi:hypothetical protein
MTFTQQVSHPIYDDRTAVWYLTPLQDRQLGGLIMWIPAGTVFIVVGLAMLAPSVPTCNTSRSFPAPPWERNGRTRKMPVFPAWPHGSASPSAEKSSLV